MFEFPAILGLYIYPSMLSIDFTGIILNFESITIIIEYLINLLLRHSLNQSIKQCEISDICIYNEIILIILILSGLKNHGR